MLGIVNRKLENETDILENLVEDPLEHLSNEILYNKLTQLPNLQYVTNYLKDVLGAGKGELQVALCVIEIDHFKRYIDFHGRIEGDRCLQQAADCMKAILKDRQGILSYFNEEQFACFLMDISPEDFVQLTETLREAIENQNLKFCWEQHSFQVTISVGGVHGQARQFKDEAEILAIAHEELYKAKSSGYNNVKIKFKQ